MLKLVKEKIILPFVIFLVGIGPIKSQNTYINKIDSDAITGTMQSICKKYNIPGISFIVLNGNEILYANSVGVRNLTKQDSLKLTDKMHIGSCTKAITGYVAGALVEEGLIKWTSSVIDIFPEFKNKINPEYYSVSLSDLLSHHARIQPFDNMDVWIEMDKKNNFTGKNIIEKRYNFSQWVLGKDPVGIDSLKGKENYVYSNAGYVVATSMLEKVTQQSWEQLIKQFVFEPLQINGGIGWPASKDINQPWGHWWNSDSTKLIPVSPGNKWYIPDLVDPAGDISMSVLDYGKWLQKNLKGLKGEDRKYPKKYYEYLHYANFESSFYSIGWGSFDNVGFTFSNHSGSARTFYCHVVIIKELNLAVAGLCNVATDQAKDGIKKLIYGTLEPYLKK